MPDLVGRAPKGRDMTSDTTKNKDTPNARACVERPACPNALTAHSTPLARVSWRYRPYYDGIVQQEATISDCFRNDEGR